MAVVAGASREICVLGFCAHEPYLLHSCSFFSPVSVKIIKTDYYLWQLEGRSNDCARASIHRILFTLIRLELGVSL